MFNFLAKHPIISVLVLLGLNVLGICLLLSIVPREREVEEESTSTFKPHRHSNNMRFYEQKANFAKGFQKTESNNERLSYFDEMGDECLGEGNSKDAIVYYNKAFDLRKTLKLKADENLICSCIGCALAYDDADDFDNAEKKFKEAVELRRQINGNASSRLSAILLQLSDFYDNHEKKDLARATCREACVVAKAAHKPGDLPLFEANEELAHQLCHQAKFAESEQIIKDSVIQVEKELGKSNLKLADLYCVLGEDYSEQEKYADAEAAFAKTWDIIKQNPKADGSLSSRLLIAYLSALISNQHRAEARKLAPVAYDLMKRRLGSQSDDLCYALDYMRQSSYVDDEINLYFAQENLKVRIAKGGEESLDSISAMQGVADALPETRKKEILSLYEKAVDRLAFKYPDQVEMLFDLRTDFGNKLNFFGNFDKAEKVYQAALLMNFDKSEGKKSTAELARAENLRDWGQEANALAAYSRALSLAEKLAKDESWRLRNALVQLADFYFISLNEPVKAESLYKRAIELEPDCLSYGYMQNPAVSLAQCLVAQGKKDEASKFRAKVAVAFQSTLKDDERHSGEKSSTVAGDLEDIANLLIDEADYAAAESKLKVAIEILEKEPEVVDKSHVAHAKLALARCLMHQDKRLDEAVKVFSEAQGLFDKQDIVSDSYAMRVAQLYDQTLKKLGRSKEADEFDKRFSVARENVYGGAYAPL